MFNLEQTLVSILFALFGGVAYIFFWKIFDRVEVIRYLVLSAITGIVYAQLRSNYGFPDLIVTFVAGWFAPDFLSGLANRLKPSGGDENSGGA